MTEPAEVIELYLGHRIRNEHKPGNLAVMVLAVNPGRRTIEGCIEGD